jgi:hypothetical protein
MDAPMFTIILACQAATSTILLFCPRAQGWRFDAVQPGLTPERFWGLRRPALASAVTPLPTADEAEIGMRHVGDRPAVGEAPVEEMTEEQVADREARTAALLAHLRRVISAAEGAAVVRLDRGGG